MEDYEYYCSEYISGVRIYFKSSREYIIYDVSIEVLDDDYKAKKQEDGQQVCINGGILLFRIYLKYISIISDIKV